MNFHSEQFVISIKAQIPPTFRLIYSWNNINFFVSSISDLDYKLNKSLTLVSEYTAVIQKCAVKQFVILTCLNKEFDEL